MLDLNTATDQYQTILTLLFHYSTILNLQNGNFIIYACATADISYNYATNSVFVLHIIKLFFSIVDFTMHYCRLQTRRLIKLKNDGMIDSGVLLCYISKQESFLMRVNFSISFVAACKGRFEILASV